MQLNKSLWYVRWFFWSLNILHEFTETSYYRYEESTNLCHFMRVTLLWTLLVLALHVLLYGWAIAALTAVPIYFYGVVSYAWFVVIILFLVGFVLALKAVRKWMYKDMKAEQKPKPQKKTEPKGPSFFDILWQYARAAKQKVCPMITFSGNAERVTS